MRIELEPILVDLRAIYDLEGAMERYHRYVHLMIEARSEVLPLGDFSPMGKRQKLFLDQLIALDAEQLASKVCRDIGPTLAADESLRLVLVVVDEPKNGWTQRYLTEAAWRFSGCQNPKVKEGDVADPRRWITVQLWTTDDNLVEVAPKTVYIERQVRASIYRAFWQSKHGLPQTLTAMMAQEGAVMLFSGEEQFLTDAELDQVQRVIMPHLGGDDYSVNFSAMYGDRAAHSVGYQSLGLPDRAGFALALSQAVKLQ